MFLSLSGLVSYVRHLDRMALLMVYFGFSVVAPIMVVVPVSIIGRNMSLTVLVSLLISSMNRIVGLVWSVVFISLVLVSVALRVISWMFMSLAIACAIVVLPVPGGPHSMMLGMCCLLTIFWSVVSMWFCPMISFKVFGRNVVASGVIGCFLVG